MPDDQQQGLPRPPTGVYAQAVPQPLTDDPSGARRFVGFDQGLVMPAIEKSTKISVDLKAALAVVAALLGGGIAAGMGYQQMTFRMSSLEQRLGAVVTKYDLSELQTSLTREQRARLKDVVVRCPPSVLKGAQWLDCKLVWNGSPD